MGNYNRKTRKKVGGVRPSELRKAKELEKKLNLDKELIYSAAPVTYYSSLGTNMKVKSTKTQKKKIENPQNASNSEPIVVQGFPIEESSQNAIAIGVPMVEVDVQKITNRPYEDLMETLGPLPKPVLKKERIAKVSPKINNSNEIISTSVMPPPPPKLDTNPPIKIHNAASSKTPNISAITPALYEDVLYITFIKSILEETLDQKTDIDKIHKYFEKSFIYDDINKSVIKESITVNMKILKIYEKNEVQPFEPENIGQITIKLKPEKSESIFEKCTPLLIAAKFGLTNMCKILIDGARTSEKIKKMLMHCDFWGNNALSLCARYGYMSLCKYLTGKYKKHILLNPYEGYLWPQETYSNIRDIDTPPAMYGDCFGKTPLMIACEKGHMEIVMFLLKQGANPLAKNDINQSALHHCVMKCCPTATNYKTPFGIIRTNVNEYYQYNLVHDDKYKMMTKVWRFNRIIHLLLRFIIFENGNFLDKTYRKDGIKLALENDNHSTNTVNDWNPLANNGNGAFSRYSVQNNSNWMGYYQTRKSSLNISRSLTFQQIAEISNYTEVYRSAFIKKNKNSKLYTSGTYESGDYTIIQNVFAQDSRACPFIAGNPNMFLELEKGFDRSVWTASGSKDFIHYFLKYLFFEEHVPHRSENDRIQEVLLVQRQKYIIENGNRSLKSFNPVRNNKTKKNP